MNKNLKSFLYIPALLTIVFFFSSCSSSKEVETSENTGSESTESSTETSASDKIIDAAKIEQENEMYSPDVDSTFLYWADSSLIILHGSTKCNIFALNVLYRAGFKTPSENTLSRDLFDTANLHEVLPVIGINDISKAKKGDIVIWSGHVIIFESAIKVNDELYAIGWWAGTRQTDNGDNIKNNVCHGKYRLEGEYVVRRPLKR